ncbi:MAG TPA: hypothetical protein VJZ71_08800 [Phycisphaerae bacterium]|nr:hypothetical protein [Phycisphaerae bacterium]
MATPQKTHENNKSSVFEKIPPDVRRQLDLAIIHRTPPTFQSVWMQFELAQYGVSFSALYRYARRLRDRVNLAEAADLVAENDGDTHETIQKLLSRRLLELLLNTGGADCTKEIAALTSAHRRGAKTAVDLRRVALDECRRVEDARVVRERLDLDRDHFRLKREALEWMQKLRTRPDAAQPLRLACSEDSQDSANDPARASARSPSPPPLMPRAEDVEADVAPRSTDLEPLSGD